MSFRSWLVMLWNYSTLIETLMEETVYVQAAMRLLYSWRKSCNSKTSSKDCLLILYNYRKHGAKDKQDHSFSPLFTFSMHFLKKTFLSSRPLNSKARWYQRKVAHLGTGGNKRNIEEGGDRMPTSQAPSTCFFQRGPTYFPPPPNNAIGIYWLDIRPWSDCFLTRAVKHAPWASGEMLYIQSIAHMYWTNNL